MGSDDFIKRDFISGDLRLEAAYDIARKSHKGQKRRDGQDYIEHPKLICNILDKFPGTTSAQKAVALLHDVLEMDEAYKAQPSRLESNLIAALTKKCDPGTEADRQDLAAWAKHVCEGVRQLTMGEYTFEGKRTTQIDAVKFISEEFRPVKIIDQAASVAGDVLYSDPRDMPELSNNKGFALKGLDVSRACRGDNHTNPYHDFYKRVFNRFKVFYEAAKRKHYDEIRDMRQNFDLEKIIADSLNPDIREVVKPEDVTQYYSPALRFAGPGADRSPRGEAHGLAHINTSDKTGKVVSFGLFVPQQSNATGSSVSEKLLGMLERDMNQSVETGEIRKPQELVERLGDEQYPNALQVRDYSLTEPIELKKLINTAKRIHAMDRRFYDEMRFIAGLGKSHDRAS